jgi:hypothetical protein
MWIRITFSTKLAHYFHASDMFRLAAKNTSEGSHCKIRIACENRLAELVQGTGSGGGDSTELGEPVAQ